MSRPAGTAAPSTRTRALATPRSECSHQPEGAPAKPTSHQGAGPRAPLLAFTLLRMSNTGVSQSLELVTVRHNGNMLTKGRGHVAHDAGDVVLSITWRPTGLGGRNGELRISHLDGRDDRRSMDKREAQSLATTYFGPTVVERMLPGQGIEWTRAPN
jgi:hypothetical protein